MNLGFGIWSLWSGFADARRACARLCALPVTRQPPATKRPAEIGKPRGSGTTPLPMAGGEGTAFVPDRRRLSLAGARMRRLEGRPLCRTALTSSRGCLAGKWVRPHDLSGSTCGTYSAIQPWKPMAWRVADGSARACV